MEKKGYLYYFGEISKIPRGSGNESQISQHIFNFAKDRNLESYKDKYNNVIVKKPATRGYEDIEPVILQGHLDMVCVKTAISNHDFDRDSIEISQAEDFIIGNQTSIGADNGVGVAYCLDILARNDIKHPKLEVVFTSNEETTMEGAINLDFGLLSGKRMINLDNEIEGKILVSSAGGIVCTHTIDFKKEDLDPERVLLEIKIAGLNGGHSGLEIHIGRANSNVLMGRLLDILNNKYKIDLVDISGGVAVNAIALETKAIIGVSKKQLDQLIEEIDYQYRVLKSEFKYVDPEMIITNKIVSGYTMRFKSETKDKVINLLGLIFSGINTMDKNIKTLVESSSNLGVVKNDDKKIGISSEIRSSSESILDYLIQKNKILSRLIGSELCLEHRYPSWPYKPNSNLVEHVLNIFKENNIKDSEIIAEHAGIECGVFIQNIDDLDAISIGPNILDCHTINERFSVSSSNRIYDCLIQVLEKMK